MEVLVHDYVSINLLQWNFTNFKGTVMVFEYNNSITCLNYDTDPPPTVRVDLKWKVTSGDILIWYCLLFGDTHNAWNVSFFAGCMLLVNRLISVYKLKMSSVKMEVLVCSYWSQFINFIAAGIVPMFTKKNCIVFASWKSRAHNQN